MFPPHSQSTWCSTRYIFMWYEFSLNSKQLFCMYFSIHTATSNDAHYYGNFPWREWPAHVSIEPTIHAIVSSHLRYCGETRRRLLHHQWHVARESTDFNARTNSKYLWIKWFAHRFGIQRRNGAVSQWKQMSLQKSTNRETKLYSTENAFQHFFHKILWIDYAFVLKCPHFDNCFHFYFSFKSLSI